MKHPRLSRAALLVALLWLPLNAGCPEEEYEGVDLVVGKTTQTLQSMLFLGHMAKIALEAPGGLQGLTDSERRLRATSELIGNVRALLTFLQCDAEVETATDDLNYVEFTVGDCSSPVFGIGLSGQLRADLSIGTVACAEGGTCPALLWDLTTTEGAPRPFRFTTVAGHFELADTLRIRAPFDATLPMSLTTARADVVEDNGLRVGASTNAEWTVDACITMTLDAVLFELPEAPLPEDIRPLYPVITSAIDLTGCLARCPDSGEANMSYAHGVILSWHYNGTNVVTVRGAYGFEQDAALPCN